jgi:hypothetical protein
MIYTGKAKGRIIELEESLPFQDGELLRVEVEPLLVEPEPGSPEAVRKAMHEPPYVSAEDVDELERAIEAGRLPLSKPVRFDS